MPPRQQPAPVAPVAPEPAASSVSIDIEVALTDLAQQVADKARELALTRAALMATSQQLQAAQQELARLRSKS